MRGYTCDSCGATGSGEPPVVIRGISPRSGILLPAQCHEHVFCQPACFWRFALKNMPDEVARRIEVKEPSPINLFTV